MYSFLLPNIVIPILTYKIIIYNNINENFISNSLHHYLNKVKGKIELYKKSWDNFKKITNNYEYIHTNIPHINKPVCNYTPLSRSFFKMIELLNELNIVHELPKNNLNSFHLAEGPGGFIEALCYLRNNISDNYHGMTLIDDNDRNIPGWKKSYSYLNKNTNINIEYGMDGTGNIMNPDNLLYCYNRFKNTMDLIKKINFMNSYSFIFSPRPGTVAAELNLVDQKKSKERLEIIQKKLFKNQVEKNESLVNTTVNVLVENKMKDGIKLFGRTEYMTSVIFEGGIENIGKIVQVKINNSNQNGNIG